MAYYNQDVPNGSSAKVTHLADDVEISTSGKITKKEAAQVLTKDQKNNLERLKESAEHTNAAGVKDPGKQSINTNIGKIAAEGEEPKLTNELYVEPKEAAPAPYKEFQTESGHGSTMEYRIPLKEIVPPYEPTGDQIDEIRQWIGQTHPEWGDPGSLEELIKQREENTLPSMKEFLQSSGSRFDPELFQQNPQLYMDGLKTIMQNPDLPMIDLGGLDHDIDPGMNPPEQVDPRYVMLQITFPNLDPAQINEIGDYIASEHPDWYEFANVDPGDPGYKEFEPVEKDPILIDPNDPGFTLPDHIELPDPSFKILPEDGPWKNLDPGFDFPHNIDPGFNPDKPKILIPPEKLPNGGEYEPLDPKEIIGIETLPDRRIIFDSTKDPKELIQQAPDIIEKLEIPDKLLSEAVVSMDGLNEAQGLTNGQRAELEAATDRTMDFDNQGLTENQADDLKDLVDDGPDM